MSIPKRTPASLLRLAPRFAHWLSVVNSRGDDLNRAMRVCLSYKLRCQGLTVRSKAGHRARDGARDGARDRAKDEQQS